MISDHAVFGIRSGQLVSARWATAQQQSPEIGINQLLTAGNADELEQAIFAIDLVYFNYVFADTLGNIGHRSSGLVPVRRAGGAEPNPGGAIDNWRGYIPKHEMPGARNPERLWVGTANHDTRGADYPYFYGSKFAPNYRYQRMIQLLGEADSISAEQSWQMTLDTHNLLAEKLAPVFSAWLAAQEGTRDLASLLDDWDYRDDADSVGATVFHTVYEEVARLTYQDEMSPALYRQFIVDRYFWQQRHDQALLEDRQAWFDDTRTPERESAGDIVVLAGERALALLQDTLGPDSSAWRWGAASRMVFVSPLRREGAGRDLLGGGEYEGRGSSETINRGAYSTERFPYDTRYIAAARMVADMADEEKVMAIIPAGSVARQGHPWMASQLPAYVEGRWIPWWRDRQRIEEHARHRLVLRPLR